MSKSRVEYLDAARGIGILLVIYGHLTCSADISKLIYSFHMPLFFFLSGLFAKPNLGFKKYVLKQAKKTLVPFVYCFLIGLTVTIAIPALRIVRPRDVIQMLVYARPIEINVGPIWFLACLFDVSVIFYFYYWFVLSKDNTVLSIYSLGVLAVFSYYLPIVERKMNIYIPFKIDVSFMGLFFYSTGFMLSEQIKSRNYAQTAIDRLIICAPAIVILTVFPHFVLGQTYLSGGGYSESLFAYIITAYSGILLVLIVAKVLEKSWVLRYMGENSLVIFSIHSIAILLYKAILSCFNIHLNEGLSIVGTVFVMVVMFLVSFVFNKLKKNVHSKTELR